MVKNRMNRAAKLDVRKTLRQEEICPHCGKRQPDLECHLKKYHAFVCEKCGKAFRTKGDWLNHMRDVHLQDERAVARAEKEAKLEKWLEANKRKPEGAPRQGKRGRRACKEPSGRGVAAVMTPFAKSPFDPALTPVEASAVAGMEKGPEDEDEDEMQADPDSDDEVGMMKGPPRCVDCGREGPAGAKLLVKQGLTYTCMLVGLACGKGNGAGALGEVQRMGMPAPAPAPAPAPLPQAPLPSLGLMSGSSVFGSLPSGFLQQPDAANVPIGDDDDDL